MDRIKRNRIFLLTFLVCAIVWVIMAGMDFLNGDVLAGSVDSIFCCVWLFFAVLWYRKKLKR